MASNRRKWLRRIAVLTMLTSIVLWLTASWAVARWMTQRRGPPFPEPAPVLAGKVAESPRLKTVDGQELGAWYIPGQVVKPAVLLMHGIGTCRSFCLGQAQMLAEAGHSVLSITLRAHGDSTGDATDFGYSSRHDVAAAVAWWRKSHPDQPLVVWGQSIGSAAAVFAAAELGNSVQGYILECPYQSLPIAARNRTKLVLPWGLELVAYCGLRCVAPLVVSDADKISPVDAVSAIPANVPVLIMAGKLDPLATPQEAEAIYERIKDHATLALFEQAGHIQCGASEPARYSALVLGFVAGCGQKMYKQRFNNGPRDHSDRIAH